MSSSRFVSGGTNEAPTEREEAWLKAQQDVEQKRKDKLESEKQSNGQSQSTLYETLQANKAAKQEAFEEAAKLKNQFPTLGEDEVDFLDSERRKQLEKEREVKKQAAQDLALFRQQQQDAEEAALKEGVVEVDPDAGDMWKTGPRKRKQGKEKMIGGVKIRRTSTAEKTGGDSEGKMVKQAESAATAAKTFDSSKTVSKTEYAASTAPQPATTKSAPPPAKPGLGLGDYSSDEDD